MRGSMGKARGAPTHTREEGSLWFFAERDSRVVSLVKSKVTGERYEGGDQGTVAL